MPLDALKLAPDNRPALVLRREHGSEEATALLLEGTAGHIETVDCGALRPPDAAPDFNRDEILERFHAFALEAGFLFHPGQALTWRELGSEGPPHCHECKTQLSLNAGSLGCTQCRYYVCRCGRCLCGYTGKNYLGQFFQQFPALPIPREQRLEFVRVVRFCVRPAGPAA
ncbi:MAG: hypothetical protein HZC42_15115 [Candidatus Eisenbacteria bacterium]|nr:hypothetical protein [Candidatus Eisenbacteria bacterium]